MKLAVDTHTHTYASGHAYSTLIENAQAAQQCGLSMFCTTDHSESMPGAPHYWFFSNQKILPRFLHDVAIVRGVEANILNVQGELDLPLSVDCRLDWMIASFHEPVFAPADKQTHTQALLSVIENGRADALGHLGNPNFDFDFETVLSAAAQHHVAIEINNTSLRGNSRVGSVERCEEIVRIGKELGVYFTTGSDAHFRDDIGNLSLVSDLLDKVGVDSSKVISHSCQQFVDFLQLRGRAYIEEFAKL